MDARHVHNCVQHDPQAAPERAAVYEALSRAYDNDAVEIANDEDATRPPRPRPRPQAGLSLNQALAATRPDCDCVADMLVAAGASQHCSLPSGARASLRESDSKPLQQRAEALRRVLVKVHSDYQTVHGRPPPEADEIRKWRQASNKLHLNVGGERHEVLWRTLDRLPRTRLGRLRRARTHADMMQLCDDYSIEKNEVFFDKHPQTFTSVINFYRTGKLHILDDVCVLSYNTDLQYWGIDEYYMEPCCMHKYNQKKENVFEEMRKEADSLKKKDVPENFGNGRCAPYQKALYDALEKPQSSTVARVIALVSVSFIVISTVTMSLNTLHDLQVESVTIINTTTTKPIDFLAWKLLHGFEPHDDHNATQALRALNNTKVIVESIEHPALSVAEGICVAWFAIELVLRFIASPFHIAG